MHTATTRTTADRKRRRSRWPAAALLVAVAGLIPFGGAWGGGTPGSSTPTHAVTALSSKNKGLLAYSQCMRSHGVPNFPDPNSHGVIVGKSSSASGGGLDPNSPTYQAAQKACQKYASGGNTSADHAKQLKQALKYSKCMRSHGVTDFPDPKLVNGQVEFPGSGIGRSPQFQSANTACQHFLASGSGS